MALPDDFVEYIQRLPKAELHCHIAGTIQPETLLELGEENGINLPFEDETGARAFFEFDGLAEFLEVLDACVRSLQTIEDFERIVVEHAAEAARQNIRYQEIFTTYELHRSRGISWDVYTEGLKRGRERAIETYGIEIKFIACIDRRIDPEDGLRLVKQAHEDRHKVGIIGIGLDSQERGYPAHRHRSAFKEAESVGFHRVAHAGEEVGPRSVWNALATLEVERIDHGVRANEDSMLVEYLAAEQIPLTVCPVSNVALNYGNLQKHPFNDLLDAGVLLTVNSDDPPMFKADLTENYLQIADTFQLTVNDVTELARNGFAASFADEDQKAEYLVQFDDDADQLRRELDL